VVRTYKERRGVKDREKGVSPFKEKWWLSNLLGRGKTPEEILCALARRVKRNDGRVGRS